MQIFVNALIAAGILITGYMAISELIKFLNSDNDHLTED